MIRLIPQPLFVNEKDGSAVKVKDFTVKEVRLDSYLGDESYRLVIGQDGITAESSSESGFFYAQKTLGQLSDFYNGEVPCCEIEDSPRFAYRGFMIDCARHMFPVHELKRMIETAASLKFNRFHWHLADDQGFRIELNCYPELTRFGSVRRGDRFGKRIRSDKEYGGYYTREEIKEVVEFCHSRFIKVIPELDVPGHSSALLHVFPDLGCGGKSVKVKMSNGVFKDVLCIGEEKTKSVIFNIFSELCELFPDEYFHIGGDEVPHSNWKSCPKCREVMEKNGLPNYDSLQQYFVNSAAEFLQRKGKKVIGWNECLKGGRLNDEMIIERWFDRRGLAVEAAENGRKTIAAPINPYYADYPYSYYSLKDVYTYEPTALKGLSDKGKENIIGVETPVWTEFIIDCPTLEKNCFPRWFAVAETGWSIRDNKNYPLFACAAEKLCGILHTNGINCTLPEEWNPAGFKKIALSLSFMQNYTTTGE